jgi:hypothetical protein
MDRVAGWYKRRAINKSSFGSAARSHGIGKIDTAFGCR